MQLRLRRRIVPTKSKWSTPVIAAVTSISMVAAAAFGGNQVLRTQENGSGPIDVASASTSFGDGETVIVEDAAISAQAEGDGPRAVKQFHRDEPFSMFAVTWKGPATWQHSCVQSRPTARGRSGTTWIR